MAADALCARLCSRVLGQLPLWLINVSARNCHASSNSETETLMNLVTLKTRNPAASCAAQEPETMSSVLAYTVGQACEVAGLGRTSLYALIKTGQLCARKHGTKTLILASDLREWLESLPELSPPHRRRTRSQQTSEVRPATA